MNQMEAKRKRILVLLAVLWLLVAQFACAQAGFTTSVVHITEHGNLDLAVSGTEFMQLGFSYGDAIGISAGKVRAELPVVSGYTDVSSGEGLCRIKIEPDGDDIVTLAINGGSMADRLDIAQKRETDTEPYYEWVMRDSLALPLEIEISMVEEGGYYDQWKVHHLERSNDRADYPHLSDGEFANFRPIGTTGMGEGVLYRSSSPINGELGRNSYADAGIEISGISTIVNLADTHAEMTAHDGWEGSYYAGCEIIALGMTVDFHSNAFADSLAEGLRFMAVNEGPYLLHCKEGKDRCGFVSAVLECLMGASAEEVIADYMRSYYNYYGVEEGSAQYEIIAQDNICAILETAFGIDDFSAANVDPAAEAREYLMEELALSADEIAQLADRLD